MGGEPREAKHAPSLPGSRGKTRLITAIATAIRLHLPCGRKTVTQLAQQERFCYCKDTDRRCHPGLGNSIPLVAMRKKTILIPMLLVLFSFCWLAGPVANAATRNESRSGGQPAIDVAKLESRIHDLINLERKNAGLPDLAWNQTLQQIARNYSQDMATRNFFSHTDPEGRTFVQRYRRAGFKCAIRKGFFFGISTNLGGENIAYNHLSSAIVRRNGQTMTSENAEEQFAAAVVRQWMTSPSHRRNILTRHYRREGIGVAIGKNGKVLITQNFC